MKRISEQKTSNVVALLNEGLSVRSIAARMGVSKSTVSRIRRSVSHGNEMPRGGRPALLTVREKRLVVRKITSGECDTATDAKKVLAEMCNTDVHANTVRNALKEAGLKGSVKYKKPFLSARHMKARFEFATKYKHWTVHDWRRVVWSDETKVNRFGSDGRKWCWKKPGSAIKSHHVQPTVKFGGGSIMVWGCMTAQGTGYACKIEGRMDSELYVNILNDELLRSLNYYGLSKDDVIFQQDNDPKHTSRLARNWFSDNRVELLDWPAQSPDMNPIEHLWDRMKRRLSGYNTIPSSMHELWERVEAEWNSITVEECLKLIDSMPSRVEAVLKANGGYTKY